MGNWEYKYDIKAILKSYSGNDEPEEIKRIAKALVEILDEKPGMENASHIINDIENAETEQELNDALDYLYDYGDQWGIWFGL